jgi:cellulose synthase/poly-beta-1,6-N-acetylglucosamine synthase-like glycosyltransferase
MEAFLEWFDRGFSILAGLSPAGIVGLLWFTFLLEFPRYILTFLPALLIIRTTMREEQGPMPDVGRVSILIPGHNEADSIEQCVLSLREQTFQDFEVICVSDGSTDDTYAIMKRLQREGKVDKIANCAIRGGKASAINLGMRLAAGDIVIVIDCDCSFDRTAIEEMIRLFADPTMGAVGGSVLVRNGEASLTASLQAIEYMISIQLGRAAMDAVGQLAIISGAFGAFRREAFMKVGMMDQGPGEDGDITMRLRLAGYRIGFAIRAIAYTDVPVHMFNLIKQRQRWERDTLWIKLRKYGRTLNPKRRDFKWKELPHQFDFILMEVVCGFVAPFYLVWLVTVTDLSFALFVIFITYLALLCLDFAAFTFGCLATGKTAYWRFAPFVLLFGPWKGYLMRYARLYTHTEEWIYSASRHDNFAPPKVNDWIRWK